MIDTSGLSDVHVFACTLFGEARSESTDGILAVACVIRNRVNDTKHRWPETYAGVCLQPKQFSCWNDGPLESLNNKHEMTPTNHGSLAKLVAKLKDGPVTDERYQECAWVATGVMKDWVRDTVMGSNHYHVISLIPRPGWARGFVAKTQVRNHVFYKL